jgi:hypothetical protein
MICDIPPTRLKELYQEINDYFYKRRSIHAISEKHRPYVFPVTVSLSFV